MGTAACPPPPTHPPRERAGEIARDGGCVDTHGGRAGWGLAFGSAKGQTMAGPLPGPWQTAQRAEVYAVLMAITMFTGPVSIITDSRYVHDRLARLLKGERPKGAHEDLWNRITSLLERVSGVSWVKAHLSQGEATRMGISEGHWRLNQLADLAASEGITMHQEDPGYWALHAFRGRAIRGWQLHLLGIYRM